LTGTDTFTGQSLSTTIGATVSPAAVAAGPNDGVDPNSIIIEEGSLGDVVVEGEVVK
jgi:hypothetical protein